LLKSSIVALASQLALEAVLARVVPDTAGYVARALSSGVPELESVRAPLALAHVVEILRADSAAADAVRSGVTRVEQLPAGAGRRALQGFLDGFGERGLTEIEALSPRFREDSTDLCRLLRAGLGAPAADPDLRLSRVRTEADSALAALENEASSFEMMLIRALLGRARAFARLRERMRVWMARTVAMMRTVTLDVDRRLRRLDPMLQPGAAFFLTEDELRNATARTRADLGALVRMRREAHARDLGRADPPDTFVGAPPRWVVPSFDGRLLVGAAASGGVATGRVRRVGPGAAGAEHLAPGDVVLLRVPDPGLAALYFWCGAVVADAGSALSHAAVVAREVGVPAVFGVVDAWSTLREGEEVRVDGDSGRVERLAP
jgi:pyruvate,water dikinase